MVSLYVRVDTPIQVPHSLQLEFTWDFLQIGSRKDERYYRLLLCLSPSVTSTNQTDMQLTYIIATSESVPRQNHEVHTTSQSVTEQNGEQLWQISRSTVRLTQANDSFPQAYETRLRIRL